MNGDLAKLGDAGIFVDPRADSLQAASCGRVRHGEGTVMSRDWRGIRYGSPEFCEAYGACWSSADEALFASFFTKDVLYVDCASRRSFQGIEETLAFFKSMLAFSPDSKIEFSHWIGDQRGFAAEWTWSGTAAGKLVLDGIVYPRTDKRFSVNGVAFCTVDPAGLVTSHKDYYDMRIVLKQLGLISL